MKIKEKLKNERRKRRKAETERRQLQDIKKL